MITVRHASSRHILTTRHGRRANKPGVCSWNLVVIGAVTLLASFRPVHADHDTAHIVESLRGGLGALEERVWDLEQTDPVPGPAGPQGPQGPQGPAGPPGEPGTAALGGQVCPAGQFVIGFDGDANILCSGGGSVVVCGNGIIDSGEACDDGNAAAGDGCSNVCVVESGFVCAGQPSVCSLPQNPPPPLLLSPGDLIITEVMPDSTVNDADGEWFEIFNTTAADLNLFGLTIRDDGIDSFTIGSSVIVPAGQFLVFARSADLALNGGIPSVDVVISGFVLENSGDEIELLSGQTVIDRVAYGSDWPFGPGASMQLIQDLFDPLANDDVLNWTPALTPYGEGDLGSPGSL